MKKIIDSIEQVISICGQDFTKWHNNMTPDVLKATYEMLKEYKNIQLKKSDFEYCGRLSEGQKCEKAYYDNECFRYHDETHILIVLKDNSKYKNLEE